MKTFPFHLQHDAMQCGVACLRIISEYFGERFTMDELEQRCPATAEGVSMLSISRTAEELGLHTVSGRLSIDELSEAPLPCILHWNQNHFVVLYTSKVQNIKKLASDMGFKIPAVKSFNRKCTTCYTENTEQFVINYDLNVYKCTARDFTGDFSIGKILDNGSFMPNSLYFKYYTTSSPVLNDNCMQCDLLPSCLNSGSCLQKKIEGAETKCFYKLIQKEVLNMVKRKIQQK